MVELKPLVFVSYEDAEARRYATEAKEVFESCGYETWVWHYDHRSAGYVLKDIAENIQRCDYFLCICTQGSAESYGQTEELSMAWSLQKEFLILTFDLSFIPEWLTHKIFHVVSADNFGHKCRKVAEDLLHQQRLGERIAQYRKEGEAVE